MQVRTFLENPASRVDRRGIQIEVGEEVRGGLEKLSLDHRGLKLQQTRAHFDSFNIACLASIFPFIFLFR